MITRLHVLSVLAAALIIFVTAVTFKAIFRSDGEAKMTLGVRVFDGFDAPTKEAVKIWNGFVGCDFLVMEKGPGMVVRSDDGAPCGDPWRPEEEWGHAATAYRCGHLTVTTTMGGVTESRPGAEILVSLPGDTHDQTCSIAHEIGHVLDRPHQQGGVMGRVCTTPILITDSDVDILKASYCK